MALVIDDRLKVWDEKDQPRVHVVPAFAPYYAPQAEVLLFHYLSACKNYTNFFLSLTWYKFYLLVGQQHYPCALCCKKCSLQRQRWFFQVS